MIYLSDLLNRSFKKRCRLVYLFNMKIIITEEQVFSLKSLNGVKSYIEEYLSQFEHFVKLDVRVSEESIGYFDTVEKPTLIYFETTYEVGKFILSWSI